MTINYHRRGGGTPLVLIHGIGHRWQAWEPVLPLLAEHHDVIAIDLPGFGASPVPAGGMPRDMAATVVGIGEFLTGLGLNRPHVAGNSLGGAISLELAAAGLARTATALSPAGFFTPSEGLRAVTILSLLRVTTFQPVGLVRRCIANPSVRALSFGALVAHPELLSQERAEGDAYALRHGGGFRAVARSARTYRFQGHPTVPVTIAWGSLDRILRPQQAQRARRAMPDARHVALTGCGHVPMSDDPGQVARIILETTGGQ